MSFAERLNDKSEIYFKRIRKNLGGWPIVDKKIYLWTEKRYQWPNIVRELYKNGFSQNYFFKIEIDVSDDDSTKKMIHVSVFIR